MTSNGGYVSEPSVHATRYEDSAALLRLSKTVLVNRLLDAGLELEDALERNAELVQDLLDADWERERLAVEFVDRFGVDDGRVGSLIGVLETLVVGR